MPSTDTVTVACKIPNGLSLRVGDFVDVTERSATAAVTTAVWRPRENAVEIKGPKRDQYGRDMEGGYALTHGVPKDFWDQWMKENKDSPLVVNKLILAHGKADSAVAEAKENEKRRSGLEPLDMSMTTVSGRQVPSDPRVPRKVAQMTTTDAAA